MCGSVRHLRFDENFSAVCRLLLRHRRSSSPIAILRFKAPFCWAVNQNRICFIVFVKAEFILLIGTEAARGNSDPIQLDTVGATFLIFEIVGMRSSSPTFESSVER
jgi:hypothetical protein